MKSILKVLTIVFFSCICIFIISCNQPSQSESSSHTHSFINLKRDAEYHWYECNCGEKISKEKHIYYEYVCSCNLQSYSPELKFSLSEDGLYYNVYDCEKTAEMVFVPTSYESLPVKTILNGAFKDNLTVKKVVIGEGISKIEENAFFGCENLEIITLPQSLTQIKDSAFEKCISLKEINLPKNLTSLGKKAFKDCSSILKIYIDRNLNIIGEQAFLNCNSLLKFEVEEHNKTFKSRNNNLLSKDEKIFIAFANGQTKTVFEIPKTVEAIDEYAFYGNEKLQSLSLSKNIKTIGLKALYIKNLQTINYTGTKEEWQNISFETDCILSDFTITVNISGESFTL